MKSKLILSVVTCVVVLSFSYVSADVPHMINYQGKLTTAEGGCLNDTLQMTFTIYSDDQGVSDEWSETQTQVVVKEGIFNVLLGSVDTIPTAVFDGNIKHLGVQVESDPEMRPLKPMVSVAYAYKAFEADTADYARAAPAVPDNDWVINGDTIYHLNGNVGIGTTSPNEQLEMTGNLRLPATTATAGIIKMGADRFIHNYGSANTFVGVDAGNLIMTGSGNTANGYRALVYNTTGSANTANGFAALSNNHTGMYNTATGYAALNSNSTGNANTANGYKALYHNTEGVFNTANGVHALYSNTTGYANTANGNLALYSNTTGFSNTATGHFALYFDTSQSNNTAVGFKAGDVYTSTNSTFLGAFAYPSASGYHNSMCLGYASRITASNQVRVGNSSVTSIGGYVGWSNISDGRYKKNISENVPGLLFISKLKPVTYTLDVDAIDAVLNPPHQPHEGQSQEDLMPSAIELASKHAQSQIVYTGFIAQEVEKVAKELGYDFSGVDAPKNDKDMYGLRYAEFVVPLVKAVQEQQQLIQELQKRIEKLEKNNLRK